jgi:hypothetical protein
LYFLLFADIAMCQEVSFLPGMMLGKGYDTVTGSIKETCIEFDPNPYSGNKPEAEVEREWLWQEVTSNSDILKVTQIDASASVDSSIFTASAEMKLLSQNEISNFDANVLASIRIGKIWKYASFKNYIKSISKILGKDPMAFQEQCGNRYIAGVLYGGSFYSLINIKSSSQTDLDSIKAGMRASYGPFTANGSIDNKSETSISNRQVTITGYGKGMSTEKPATMTIDEIKKQFQEFPGQFKSKDGTEMRVLLQEYPKIFISSRPLLNELARQYWDYVSVEREISYVMSNSDQFFLAIDKGQNFLSKLKKETQDTRKVIDDSLKTCRQLKSNCSPPSGIRSADAIRADLPPRYKGKCGQQTIDFDKFQMSVYPLGIRCGGDTQMFGNNPKVDVTANVVPMDAGHYIDIVTNVTMVEQGGDKTCLKGTARKTLNFISLEYPGCYLSSNEAVSKISPSQGSLAAYGGNSQDWQTFTNGSGLIKEVQCRTDTGDDDFGVIGCAAIRINNIALTLNHEEDRMKQDILRESAANMWINKIATQKGLQDIGTAREERLQAMTVNINKAKGADFIIPSGNDTLTPTIVPSLKILENNL